MTEVSVQIPKLTMAAVNATFIGWIVPDGSRVEQQQAIYQVATDKVDVDVESPASGILRHGDVEVEEEYPVGHVIGTIDVE